MSFAIASAEIFSDRRLSGADLRVLLAILSHTRPNKPYCWPSRARLAECIGIKSHSRVSEILARLVAYGWLSIKRTGRSSLYTVHAPCPTSDVHPVQDIEDKSEYLEERPPYPPSVSGNVTENQGELVLCNVSLDDSIPAVGVIEQPDSLELDQDQGASPETIEQPDDSNSHQGEEAETTDHREAVEPTESVPAPAPDRKPRPTPEQRLAAVQKVLDAFRATSGIDYSNRPATERRIARRIAKYGEGAIVQAIQVKGQAFRHPISILKPSILESVLAEIEAETRARQETLRRDREALDAMRKPTGTRTTEGAKKGLQMLRAAVGLPSRANKPDESTLPA